MQGQVDSLTRQVETLDARAASFRKAQSTTTQIALWPLSAVGFVGLLDTVLIMKHREWGIFGHIFGHHPEYLVAGLLAYGVLALGAIAATGLGARSQKRASETVTGQLNAARHELEVTRMAQTINKRPAPTQPIQVEAATANIGNVRVPRNVPPAPLRS